MAVPSNTWMVIVELPKMFVTGFIVTEIVPFRFVFAMFATGNNAVFDDLKLTTKLPAAVSTSLTLNCVVESESSLVVTFNVALITGTSFTALTVKLNVAMLVALSSSVTDTVIILTPFILLTGFAVTVTVPFTFVVTNALTGNNPLLLDCKDTFNVLFAVSISPMLNVNRFGVSSFVV